MPHGIPHSVFLNWDPDDQDKALAYMRAQREPCGRCGTRESEWEKDKFAYIGQTRHCLGCETLKQESENVPEDMRDFVHVYLAPKHLAKPPDERLFER